VAAASQPLLVVDVAREPPSERPLLLSLSSTVLCAHNYCWSSAAALCLAQLYPCAGPPSPALQSSALSSPPLNTPWLASARPCSLEDAQPPAAPGPAFPADGCPHAGSVEGRRGGRQAG
jgi:hypothetical protein